MTSLLSMLQCNDNYALAGTLAYVMTAQPDISWHRSGNVAAHYTYDEQNSFIFSYNRKTLAGNLLIYDEFCRPCYFYLQSGVVFGLIHTETPIFIIWNNGNMYPVALAAACIKGMLFSSDLARVAFPTEDGYIELFLTSLIQRYIQLKKTQRAIVCSAESTFISIEGALESVLLACGRYAVLFADDVQIYGTSVQIQAPFKADHIRANGEYIGIRGEWGFAVLKIQYTEQRGDAPLYGINAQAAAGQAYGLQVYAQQTYSDQAQHGFLKPSAIIQLATYRYSASCKDFCVANGTVYLLLDNGDFGYIQDEQFCAIDHGIHCIFCQGEEAIWGRTTPNNGVQVYRGFLV